MGEAPAPWDGGYLDRCFARHRVCISFGLWICSSCCWLAAHALLLYLRCVQSTRRTGRGRSALGAVCFLLASLCDPVGAILAKQLPIQVFTGAYLAAVRLVGVVSVLSPTCSSKSTSGSGECAAVREAGGAGRSEPRREGQRRWEGLSAGKAAGIKGEGELVRVHYMELTVEPGQRAGRGATQLPGEGQTCPPPVSPHEPPSYPPVQVIRAQVSSSSGSEASSINSDLEQKYWEALNSEQWDPEDTNLRRDRGCDMEMLRVQVLGGSRRPVGLNSDE
ncbi:transmembrane protein 44 [Sorex araneus]|uniref:transmembrane protein 44 n=1 Tax=Sorex araneus TaxID=42254 RepID=UPI0024336ECE|nr:transmembrane protein 44 [Sorex araneus]